MTVRILFDGGSQRSYMTGNVSMKLGLKSVNTETLHLNTFGKFTHRKQRCEVVSLPIWTNDDEYVRALKFPMICSPLTERAHLQDHLHLQELELVDSAQSLNSIDILSSSDHYWDFVTGESIRGDFGPTAVKSKLGWLLSGPTNNSQNETNVVSDLVITGESFSNGAKESDEMAGMLERLWDVEGLGIVETNYESELVKRKGDITFNYEVELPWRGDCLPQSNNYEMCVTVIAFKIEEGAEFAEGRKRKKGIVENCAGDRRSNAR